MRDIEALAWELLERIDTLHRQGKLSKAALLSLNDPATELRRALMRAAINYALSGFRLDVRESEPGAAVCRRCGEPMTTADPGGELCFDCCTIDNEP
jgi:hypothetical protein